MKIIAHRGARGYEPENTLAAFKRALEIGVDGIELDVYVLKTGELVVIHDIMVNRTTTGDGYVADFNFDELRKLDAGNGQKVPTLAEVIELVDKKVPIFIELKAVGTAAPVAKLLNEYLQKGWSKDDFEVISFNHVEIAAFKQACPDVPVGLSVSSIPTDYCAFAKDMGVNSVMLCVEFLTPDFVKDAHDAGITVNAFTGEPFNCDRQSEIERIEQLGVDGFASDRPDVARKHLAKTVATA